MNFTQALGWTLLHFLWQGALIAVLLAMVLAFVRQASSRVRYGLSCAALLSMLTWTTATFLNLLLAGEPAHPVALSFAAPAATFRDYLPALVWAWFGGVIALSVRSLGGWVVTKRFSKQYTWPAEEAWERKFAELTERLSISRPVRLVVSALAEVPAVVGWLSPVVLVPASVFTGLKAEQIEALLAHELAHVRRHDYFVNLLQTTVETLLFYHPAVWWVNRTIRAEREHCCDDLAVEVCGDKMTYVRALTELEELLLERIPKKAPGLAMAADGSSLVGRVQRLLGMGPREHSGLPGWAIIAGIVACLSVAGIAVNAWAQQPKPTAPQAAAEQQESGTWLDQIEAAGYRGLDVDQLIRLKEHDVDGVYIRQIRAAGLELTVDELVRFREHDIATDFIDGLKQAGLVGLKADDLIRLSEHDADPTWIREIQALGYSNLSVEDVIRLREHEVTVESIKALKEAGLADLKTDDLIRLSERSIDPGTIRGLQSLGYANASVDDLVRLGEHEITPEFIRKAQQRFERVRIDQLIQLKEYGILE